MAEETFENQEIAEYLNKHFISIKVDREERPDIDRIYMNFVQVTTGQGGWPLSVFLTPDGKPFFGGTYFPPYSKYGRLGFIDVLTQIQRAWSERGAAVTDSANEILNRFKDWFENGKISENFPSADVLSHAANMLKSNYDREYGGFGDSPKFPQPSLLRFLLYFGFIYRDSDAINMVLKTCKAMASGGIHDHVGGGFHRYSVDRQWILPHFEKMLYDNALLLLLFSEVYQFVGTPLFAETARATANYIFERLRSPEGAFYSAEDADSEGEEGKYYLWSYEDLKQTLSREEFELAREIFNLQPAGNYTDPLHPTSGSGKNILYLIQTPPEDEKQIYANLIQKLKQIRNLRQKPFRDEKILTSWNGFAIAALARAGFILDEPTYIKYAAECIHFIKSHLYNPQACALYHSWFNREVNKTQIQEDYAAFIWGLIEYHQVTLDSSAIEFAFELADSMLLKFEDKDNGGFWQSPHQENNLIYNLKDSFDGAVPCGNSIAANALLRLYDITGNNKFLESAERTFRFYFNQLNQQPFTLTEMIIALGLYHRGRLKAAILPDSSAEFKNKYLKILSDYYLPGYVHVDFSVFKRHLSDNAFEKDTLYICSDKQCYEPIKDLNLLPDILKKHYPFC